MHTTTNCIASKLTPAIEGLPSFIQPATFWAGFFCSQYVIEGEPQ